MKTTLVLLLCVCVTVLFAAAALAGDYHTGTRLKCSQCHVMHATKTHTYSDDVHDEWTQPTQGTGHESLLKDENPTAVCLECHDGGDVIDVVGTAGTGQPANRSAGQFNGTTDGLAEFSTELGHDLGIEKTAPGGGPTIKLSCGNCHDVHGNSFYRNLQPISGNEGVTYHTATAEDPDNTLYDVRQKIAAGPGPNMAQAYDVTNIVYNKPTSAANARMAKFCAKCHPGIHNTSKVGGDWLKHPTAGVQAEFTNDPLNSRVPTLGGEVSCVSCHKAHGSTHPFGLIYDNRTTPAIEDGTKMQQTCKQCHDKGLTTSE